MLFNVVTLFMDSICIRAIGQNGSYVSLDTSSKQYIFIMGKRLFSSLLKKLIILLSDSLMYIMAGWKSYDFVTMVLKRTLTKQLIS